MRIGAHLRTSKGIVSAAERAREIGCEAMQIFAANPSAWQSRDIDPGVAARFRESVASADLLPVTIHTQYLINLASPDPDIYRRSSLALADSMTRGHTLGARYVVTHIGSHRGTGFSEGLTRICQAVDEAFAADHEEVLLLLENSAGAGDSVGSDFAELRAILDCLPQYRDRLGICLDTAHLWGAGYDLSSKEHVDEVMAEFDTTVGLDRLYLLHLNDTKVALGAHRDRHANIGTGHIGEEGFSAILHHPGLTNLTAIIETPPRPSEADERDLDILKRLREAGATPRQSS